MTSFPEIPGIGIPYSPVRNYCITSNFIDTYFGEMDESLIFLGACSSAKDDVFAQSLINKGAAVVMGYSDVTAMEYEMMTRTMFFYGLTKGNDTGGFYTISQALDYAKKCIGSSDPWSGYRSELVCFTNKDNYEDQYTLNGLIQGDALIKEADIDFAKNYYNQLASTIGLADDFIETKSITVVDQGATSNCLTPDNAELGIVFKETADFDGNGIDDLIVVTLEDCDGCIKLVETVYFFDEVGNYTSSSSSYSNLFTNNSNYYFYKAGDCIVKIIEEDNSGDWIDGLRYEIIENNVKIHGDHIFIRSYDMNAPDNGNSLGEVLYVHKDFRYPDNVCYTIDDADNYYAIYNRGFILNSSDDKCFAAENEACDYIDSLLSDLLDDKIRKIQPTTWENRWDTGFFPTDEIPESYTKLKISGSPSYKTGDKTTENNIVIDAEYVNSR